MKKLFSVALASLAILLLTSSVASASQCAIAHPDTTSTATPPAMHAGYPALANSIVPCGQYPDCACELSDFFVMIRKVYIFIVWDIATPLAGLLIVLGGTLLLLSGANRKLHEMGKTMLWGAAIGIALIFGAYLIVGVVFMALGYQGAWSSPF